MIETWHLLEDLAGAAAWNMAVDEALLHTAVARGRPLLRVYAWDRPSVSIGYFQKYPAHLAATQAIVRRPTGGGLVYHGEDTTITVVAPPGHRLAEMKTADAYCEIHQAVATALETGQSRRSATLHAVPPSSPRGHYECFANPVAGDVVVAGRKLAGGAQRRTKCGLLHQGSIVARIEGSQLVNGFTKAFDARFERYELSDAERALAERLMREKYATETWTKRVT